MSGDKIMALSIVNRRAWNRMTQIVRQADHDVLDSEDKAFRRDALSRNLSGRVAVAVADVAHTEGLTLTAQVR